MEAAALLSKMRTAPGSDLQLYNRNLLQNQSTQKEENKYPPDIRTGGVYLVILSTDSDFIKLLDRK